MSQISGIAQISLTIKLAPNNALHADAKSWLRENISQEDEMKFRVKKMEVDSAGELDLLAGC